MNILPAIILVLSVLFCGKLFAEEAPDLANFRDLSKSLESTIIFHDSFDQPFDPGIWFEVPATFRQVPGEGYNGTGALFHERLHEDDRLVIMRGRVRLEHGVEYQCRFRLRSEEYYAPDEINQGSMRNNLSMVNVIYRKDGKWTAISASQSRHKDLPPGEWQELSHVLSLPNDCDPIATIDLYLRKGIRAKVWLDDLTIQAVSRSGASVYPLNSGLLVNAKRAEIRMGASQLGQKRPDADLAMLMNINGLQRFAPSINGVFTADFGSLAPGEYQLQTQLLDTARKEILSTDQYPMTVPEQQAQQGAVTIDQHGRTIVDGKPFFPIAIFSGFSRPPSVGHLKEWKAGGFNSLMYYHPIKYLHIDGKKTTQAEDILSSLDQMEKHGLKMIFSLFYQHMIKPHGNREEFDEVRGLNQVTEHVVNLVKDHPAMLAYYVSDENSLEEYPAVRALRERISKIDLWHPTVTLTNNSNFFAPCCKTGDILSYDYYPVRTVPLEKQTIDYYDLRYAGALGVPHWFTAQAMQWTRDRDKGARSPQIQELRAMCYAALIFNCKGFMFYSYPSILGLIDIDEADGKQLWSNIQTIAKELGELSEWILSLEEAPPVPIEQNNAGNGAPEVLARAFMAGNKMKVLVVSNGPGAAEATLELAGNFRSVHGLTTKAGSKTYRFQAKYVTADLLIQE